MHYAVNRPLGGLRGEGDLSPLLTWLRQYSAWLEDRVRLNKAVRSYLWLRSIPVCMEERSKQTLHTLVTSEDGYRTIKGSSNDFALFHERISLSSSRWNLPKVIHRVRWRAQRDLAGRLAGCSWRLTWCGSARHSTVYQSVA